MNKRMRVAGGKEGEPAPSLFLIARFTRLCLCSGQEGRDLAYEEPPPKNKVGIEGRSEKIACPTLVGGKIRRQEWTRWVRPDIHLACYTL